VRNVKVVVLVSDTKMPSFELLERLRTNIQKIRVQHVGKEPLGRPRRRWLVNIRMDLIEVGWSDVDWIGLAQDKDRWRALVNSVLKLRVP
jgi:hypothetical protein